MGSQARNASRRRDGCVGVGGHAASRRLDAALPHTPICRCTSLLSVAVGRVFAVVALVAAGEGVAVSAFETTPLLSRVGALKDGDHAATFTPPLRLRFVMPYQASVGLSKGELAPGERLRSPSMLHLIVEPKFYRMEIEALGDAWLSPSWTNGALVGRLLLRF